MATDEQWMLARRRFVDDGHGESVDGVVLPRQDELGPLAEQFLALSHDLFTVPPEEGVVGVLERVVRRAAEIGPKTATVSVTLREPDGTFHTPVETDPTASRADEIQYGTNEGPCIEVTADSSSAFTVSRDLAHDERYPRFGPRVAELGFRAVCATGMFPGGERPRLGALNLYFSDPDDVDGVDRDSMLLLAAHAAVALRAARHLEAEKLRTAQLTEGLESRDVIGQAKGILMERRGATADEAFDILRRTSQDLNVKLRDLARTLSQRRSEL
ncbi:ANTAR domain-containing protein [Actinomycetospora atypica]|uniref:ANTAR domain-containing protein n=1 Tax=Actinomycetospora atypica TaxID=1290095 RepID=A0ABV9YU74_9PSEU